MKAYRARERRGAICVPPDNKDKFLRRLRQAQQQGQQRVQKPDAQVGAVEARAQFDCLTAYFAEVIGQELPSHLSARLKGTGGSGLCASPMDKAEFTQICDALARKHNTCNPCLLTSKVVKQGWVYKRSGQWNFWHKYFAVVRGQMLTFFTIDNPTSELSDEQLRWHTKRSIDLSRCSLSTGPAAGSDPGIGGSTNTLSVVGAHLASGAVSIRFSENDDARAWAICLSEICAETSKPVQQQYTLTSVCQICGDTLVRVNEHEYCTDCDAVDDDTGKIEEPPELTLLQQKQSVTGMKLEAEKVQQRSQIDPTDRDFWLEMYGATNVGTTRVSPKSKSPQVRTAPRSLSRASCRPGGSADVVPADPIGRVPEQQQRDANVRAAHCSRLGESRHCEEEPRAFLVALQAFSGISTEACTAALWESKGDIEKAVAQLLGGVQG